MRTSIVAVTSELPWPLNTGGKLRTFHLQKALAQACDVRLVVPVLAEQGNDVESLRNQGINVVPVPVPPRTRTGEFKRILNARQRDEPYVMFGRHARDEVFAAIERELRTHKPDCVWLDHIDSLLFEPLARAAGVKTVIDLHNVYSLILSRLANETRNPVKRVLLRGETKRMQAMERRAVERCQRVLAVSEMEARHFRALGATAVRVIPNGVDCTAFASLPIGREGDNHRVLFLGTLNWGPNVGAAVAMARDIFPKLLEQFPDAELMIVGKDPCPEVTALAAGRNVTVAGSVPSVIPYLQRASVLAVPLDSGGGTRLKILEAFAAGLPVVSTAIGIEGIDAVNARHYLLAERTNMASVIANAWQDPARLRYLAAQARHLAEEFYDWNSIGLACVNCVTGSSE